MDYYQEIILCISKIARIPKNELNEDTKIYDSKIISSLQILEIMSFLEKQFDIMINPEELIPENFYDIRSLIKFTKSKSLLI